MQHLRQLTHDLIERIVDNVQALPQQFKELCIHLKREAEHKFPDEYPRTTFASVGGFLFLRFLCPALVVPQKYGLLEIAPGPQISRDLMMLSKVLQTVANGVFFGKKEEYLLELNDFVKDHQSRLLQMFDELARDDTIKTRPRSLSADRLDIPERNSLSRRNTATTEDAVRLLRSSEGISNPVMRSSPHLVTSVLEEDTDSPTSENPEGPSVVLRRKRVSCCSTTPEPPPRRRRPEVGKPLPPVPPPRLVPRTYADDEFSYGELMGIIQYLKDYWPKMKPHLVKMDNNLGTKHTEDYIQLSVIMERLGVRSVDAENQLSDLEKTHPPKKKRTKFGGLGGRMLSSIRAPRTK